MQKLMLQALMALTTCNINNMRPVKANVSARSVAASYKPPMLVTRVQLPACAFQRTVLSASFRNNQQQKHQQTKNKTAPDVRHRANTAARVRSGQRKQKTNEPNDLSCPSRHQCPEEPPPSRGRSAGERQRYKATLSSNKSHHGLLRANVTWLSSITSARSVAASYKPPMLVTRVRLPACAFQRTVLSVSFRKQPTAKTPANKKKQDSA